MPQPLRNGHVFPDVHVPALGGGSLALPRDLAGSYGVVLIYRGHWCPFCNEQMAAFSAAHDALTKDGIRVAAFSVEDEATTQAFVAKHAIPFAMGHSADVDAIVAATGAYENTAPARGRVLESTGFVLAPDGAIVNATYSSRAIGRLAPGDVIRLVAFMKSLAR